MIAIELSQTEVSTLRTVLEARLKSLIVEIDRSDVRVFRDELRRQAHVVEHLLTRLPPDLSARAAS
jgi:hypothetical protein